MSELRRSTINRLSGLQEVRRLGKNIKGYCGETIDIAAVLSDCVTTARSHGWAIEELRATSALKLLALTHRASRPATKGTGAARGVQRRSGRAPRLYLSTGIHGDEPAGPLAMRQLLQDNQWPGGAELAVCPCLNPAGFLLNRRENAEGLDLNRQYRQPTAPETLAHIAWLERQPVFDLCLCLHEDWESHGFYVYELNPENRPSLAEAIVAAVKGICPIDRSEFIEGRPASNGIIRPNFAPQSRPDWPEAFHLVTHKTRLSYTLEAPSDFPLSTRVAALVAGVKGALRVL